MKLNQFDIILVNLNPTKGSEQKGENRPCLILQTNAVSDFGRTTLIAPLTTQKISKIYPYEVLVISDDINNLIATSKIKLDQIRVIDKSKIIKKQGKLKISEIEKIDQALKNIFDLNYDFRE